MLNFLDKVFGLLQSIIGKTYIISFAVVVAVYGFIGMFVAPIVFASFYLLGFIVKTICIGYKEGFEHTHINITTNVDISE